MRGVIVDNPITTFDSGQLKSLGCFSALLITARLLQKQGDLIKLAPFAV
ncbi:hypothetical protein Pla110_37860 [Polystyrenella longa]|uniref:Uncharacterized protein n=1 Tax=Polystyrenella longa TaxID=2528007 RepID=A0A518CS44_9PLAN|nr:hypothetical protein [Polystyrenella longa]QDU82032.1 hypothetical protein Pla110_37860 [Polystyrenella longa]